MTPIILIKKLACLHRQTSINNAARTMKTMMNCTIPNTTTYSRFLAQPKRLAGALSAALAFGLLPNALAATTVNVATPAAVTAAASATSIDSLSRLLLPHPAVLAGQSATQLADGQWLIIGGATDNVAGSQAWRIGADGQRAALPTTLHLSRSHHSATLLPTGQVLILGGVDSRGAAIADAELFDPATGVFTDLGGVGLSARSDHSATVQMDGRILLAGGVDAQGAAIRDVELYDPITKKIERLAAKLHSDRIGATALLLPDNRLLIWSGQDKTGQTLATAEVYSPDNGQFTSLSMNDVQLLATGLNRNTAPAVSGQAPVDGAASVPVTQRVVIRFSQTMAVASFNTATVTLMGPNGAVGVTPVALDNGILLFATPNQELLPASPYTLFVQGATDRFGQKLPLTAIGFKTAALGSTARANAATIAQAVLTPAATVTSAVQGGNTFTVPASSDGAPVPQPKAPTDDRIVSLDKAEDGELWVPGVGDKYDHWRTGNRELSKQVLPRNLAFRRKIYGYPELMSLTPADVALKKIPNVQLAANGVTAVSGQVLRLNGKPLVHTTLSIGEHITTTDDNGEFVLSGIPSGRQVLVIDGDTADVGNAHYGRYEYGVEVEAGKENPLPFIIWLSRLNTQKLSLDSPTQTETVLTNPQIPGLELHIPPGMVIRDAHGKIVTELSMTAVPVNQAPFPLPHIGVPIYFTIQPGGSHLESINSSQTKGAQLIYPNYQHSKPGTRMTFWDYDAQKRGWYEYGHGTVSANGRQVIPDDDVRIYEFTGAMISTVASDAYTPPAAPKFCFTCELNKLVEGLSNLIADPVDASNGLFMNSEVDMAINDVVPIAVDRVYRPADNINRAFGVGTTMSYDMFLSAGYVSATDRISTYAYLVTASGDKVTFNRVSGGYDTTSAVFQSLDEPGSPYYGAIIKWDVSYPGANWSVTLKTGDIYYFPSVMDGGSSARDTAAIGMKDRFGNLTQLVRNSTHLTQIISPSGRNIYLTYDATYGHITQLQDDLGRTVSYTYDGSNRLTQVTDPAGKTTIYTYGVQTLNPLQSIGGVSTSTNMLTVTDKNGNVKVTNVYDGNGRVSSQTYADGRTFSFVYTLGTATGVDGVTRPIVTQSDATDERGTVTRRTFGPTGAPLTVTTGYGTAIAQTTTLSWNATTNLLDSTTDALSRVTAYQYDRLGNKTHITALSGTANAVSTSAVYDLTFSLPTSVTDANGNTTTFTYDNLGNLTQVTDPLTHATVMTYDTKGRTTSIKDALTHTTSFAYTGGDPSSVTDALGRTVSTYTDALGRPTSVTDMLGNRTYVSYDSLDRPTATTNPRGSVAQLVYDGNGNVTTQTDEANHSSTFTFDGRDRVTGVTDPLTHSATATYEPGGNLKQSIDNKGQITNRTYDALGRLTGILYGSNAGGTTSISSTTFTWDAGNRITQIVDSLAGTTTYTHDLLDRLTGETTPQGTITRTFDAGGRRLTMTVTGQPTITYSYDVANRLTQIQQAAGTSNGNVVQTITYTYDNANRLTKRVYANGINANYSYDNGNQITGITYTKADGTAIGTLTYTYDNAGHRTSMGGTLAQTNPGNPVSATTFNANNQMTAYGTQTLTYDANGNLTSDGTHTYTWNERNQLQSISGGTTASFQYDAFGRRIGKTIGTTSTGYLYDGANFIQEKSGTGSGATVTANLVTAGVDNVLLRETGAGGNQTMLTDALGSVLLATDATQSTVTTYTYDAYGNTTQTGTNDNSQQYTGRENDQNGLYYYRARYYSTQYGRFISQDPIGWGAGQTNGFSYVNGNPIQNSDPSGLCIGPLIVPCIAAAEFAPEIVVAVEAIAGLITGAVSPTSEVGSTIAEEIGAVQSFNSFRKAKAALGTKPGEEIHHIVEQCQAGRSGFSPTQINSTDNLMRLPEDIHKKISALYSSSVPGGGTLRDSLNGLPFEQQYNIGLGIVRDILQGK